MVRQMCGRIQRESDGLDQRWRDDSSPRKNHFWIAWPMVFVPPLSQLCESLFFKYTAFQRFVVLRQIFCCPRVVYQSETDSMFENLSRRKVVDSFAARNFRLL